MNKRIITLVMAVVLTAIMIGCTGLQTINNDFFYKTGVITEIKAIFGVREYTLLTYGTEDPPYQLSLVVNKQPESWFIGETSTVGYEQIADSQTGLTINIFSKIVKGGHLRLGRLDANDRTVIKQ